MTFDEVYAFTDMISSPTAFSETESRALYDALMSLPDESNVLEVGCQYGRSTSIIAQVAKEKRLRVYLVDNFTGEHFLKCMEMLDKVGCEFVLCRMDSSTAADMLTQRFGLTRWFALTHIDAGHNYEEVFHDCLAWIPVTRDIALFHDYNRESLPGVRRAVDVYMNNDRFTGPEIHETLAVFRRRG